MRLCAEENRDKLQAAYEKMERVYNAIPSCDANDDIWEDAYNIIFKDGGIRDLDA